MKNGPFGIVVNWRLLMVVYLRTRLAIFHFDFGTLSALPIIYCQKSFCLVDKHASFCRKKEFQR